MRKKTRSSGGEAIPRIRLGRLTSFGLLLVAAGWGLLLLSVLLADVLIAKAPRFMPPVLHTDLIELSRCVIISGFGVAIVGALRAGFDGLSGHFAALPLRTATAEDIRPDSHLVMPATPMMPERVSPGQGKRRPYRVFADGSVEVDTIVGTRIFKSMAEAREFI